MVWQGTGERVKTTADVVITGRAGWHVLPPCRRNCPAPCANHGANAPTHHNTPTPRGPECEHAPRCATAAHGPAGTLKSALSLIGRVKMCLYIKGNIEARILNIRGLGHVAIGALRAARGGCGKGALMGALRFVGV